MKTQGYFGIDVGTQGLSVIFTDEDLRIRGTGAGSYEMVPGLEAGAYEQRPADWERQQAAIASWVAELPKPIGILACTGWRRKI